MHHNKAKPTKSKPLLSLAWTKRRARILVRAFKVSRAEAVKEAFTDYQDLHGTQPRSFR